MLTEIDQAEAHAADVVRACEALHAVTHGDRHAYVDTATGAAYLVDDEALAVYGRMLTEACLLTRDSLLQAARYRERQTGERAGQALFNVLRRELPDIAEQLRGTAADPFYCTKGDARWTAAIATIDSYLATQPNPAAYLRWCETTDAREIDALYIIHMLERSHDLDALRAEADADAEFDIVVAIDLLRPTLEALLREESDEDDANDEVPAQGSDVVNTRGLF